MVVGRCALATCRRRTTDLDGTAGELRLQASRRHGVDDEHVQGRSSLEVDVDWVTLMWEAGDMQTWFLMPGGWC
jgi:hypothetical protein